MIIIVNIDDRKFRINGVPYMKNFMPHVINEKLRVVNVYDTKLTLTEFNSVDKYSVNGTVYATISELQNALLPVLYTRASLGGAFNLAVNVEGETPIDPVNQIEFSSGTTVENLTGGKVRVNLNGNQNNTWREVFLGFSTGTKTSTQALFNQELVVSETENVMLVYVDMSIPRSTYKYKFAKGKGTYNPIPMEIGVDILLESVTETFPSIPVIIDGANTQTFNLGDLGETALSEFVNSNGEYDMEDDSKTYLFLFERDEVTYLYRFVGTPGLYGVGFLETVEEDFDFLTSSEVEVVAIDQDNIPKKVTYTFAELELDPVTATHEEIIAAVKIANAGDEVADNELRYIEVVDGLAGYNFDITMNWGELGIIDEGSFRTYALENYGWEDYALTDFNLDADRLQCNITAIGGNPTFYIDMLSPGYIIHNLALENIDGIITYNSGETTIENIELFEGLRYLMLSELTNTEFTFNLPSTMTEIGIVFSQLKSFTSPILSQSLTYLDLRNNQFETGDYEAMEDWAAALDNRDVYGSLTIDFSENPDSPLGTTLATILDGKGIQVIYE